jgi:ribonuclease PH
MTTAITTPTTTTRTDGRLPNQLRPVTIQRQYTKHAPGSVLISVGDTKVLITVSIEERVPRHIQDLNQANGLTNSQALNQGQGWLTAEYAMLPGATAPRNQRERMKLSGRSSEIQRLLGRSLRCAVDLGKLGARTITVDADVIQADGGTRVAAITGAYVALVDALHWLQAQQHAKGLTDWEVPLLSPVAAISVGLVKADDGQLNPLLDLCYTEDSQAEVDANVVMDGHGEFIEVQATAEGLAMSRPMLDAMLTLAEGGIQDLLALQQVALSATIE